MAEVDAEARAKFWREANSDVIRQAAESMFGEPNPRLSTRTEARFGSRGSISVSLTGDAAGAWHDFERGEGGLLPVPDAAFRELAGMRGGQRTSRPAQRAPAPDPKPSPVDQEREAAQIVAALRIWHQTQSLRDSIAEHYLRVVRRRNAIGCLDLRFHPSLDFEGQRLPALVAAMRCVHTGKVVGIHRTYLDPTTGAKVGRRMKGRARETANMFEHYDRPVYGLGICEGIEDALAARSMFQPLWALASAGGIAKFPILAGIDALTIFADADPAGQRAAAECAERWTAAGAEVVIVNPEGYKDIDEAVDD